MEQPIMHPIPEGIYRHYKGGVYRVLAVARHSETLEELVIYCHTESHALWARPLSMWNETVETEQGRVLRFTPIPKEEAD